MSRFVYTVGGVSFPGEANSDVTDRLRLSSPFTLFDLHSVHGPDASHMQTVTYGTGDVEFHEDSYVKMSVTDQGVGRVVRQSYEYILYQPEKCKHMVFSGVLNTNMDTSNHVVSRIGSFDSGADKTAITGHGNGHFFELSNGVVHVVERWKDIDIKVPQSQWNGDKLDGTGRSKIKMDWSKAVIFIIDKEWLGVGSVRFGVRYKEKFHAVHVMSHVGSEGIQRPYVQTPKLPVRYEFMSTAPANAEMRMFCCSIVSEGGHPPHGTRFACITPDPVELKKDQGFQPVIAIRLIEKEPYNRVTLQLINSTVETDNGKNNKVDKLGSVIYQIVILPDSSSLSGGTWSNVLTNSSVAQSNTTARAVDLTGARTVYASVGRSTPPTEFSYTSNMVVNSDMHGKSRVLCVVAKTMKKHSDTDVYATLSWNEIR